MRVDLRYAGASAVSRDGLVSLAPNLAREQVAFDGELKDPVRFREAISALHDVVIGDQRFQRRDRAAHQRWLDQRRGEEELLRQATFEASQAEELARTPEMPPGLEAEFQKAHEQYWGARDRWLRWLQITDWRLWRHLVPMDPVVTVAADAVLFEAFSKDESSYGCLSLSRDALRGDGTPGTTNVDYSQALYDQFQGLRSYRAARLRVDPSGFEVEAAGTWREEKIDLPASWLRGFGQLQAASVLPGRAVELPVEVVYAVLAHLKRHREKTGPRAIRFELVPRRAPKLVLEPWGIEIQSRGAPYEGARPETIRVWGRRRLSVLARLLPMVDRFEVRLLGSGMPSTWIAWMGELRFTLALSGWTTNDWTRAGALDGLVGGLISEPRTTARVERALRLARRATVGELAMAAAADERDVLASLHELAKLGQVLYDHGEGAYRWRQILPVALSAASLGPEPEEVAAGRALVREVKVGRDEVIDPLRRLIQAKVDGTTCEALFDPDGGFKRARCSCRHFHKLRLKAGPCRHLLALALSRSAAREVQHAGAPLGVSS